MSEPHIYKEVTLVGTSGQSVSDAIRRAVERAAATLRHLDWFEVQEIRGRIEDGRVAGYQVVLRVGFRLEEPEAD
ncbi:Dodecin [bacterium HR39]|nr:Dodecin [bacterium HR39]